MNLTPDDFVIIQLRYVRPNVAFRFDNKWCMKSTVSPSHVYKDCYNPHYISLAIESPQVLVAIKKENLTPKALQYVEK